MSAIDDRPVLQPTILSIGVLRTTGPPTAERAVAELLGRRLATTGAATCLADLDDVAFVQRAQLDLAEFWRRAGVVHSVLVRGWFEAGADVVIAHGSFFESRSYDLLFAAAPDDALRHHVLLRASFEIAVHRVTVDPGRGVGALSLDRELLRAARPTVRCHRLRLLRDRRSSVRSDTRLDDL